jgi:hypothetical protein
MSEEIAMKKIGLSALVLLLTMALVGGSAIGGDWHDSQKVRKYNNNPTDKFKRYQSQRYNSAEKHGDLFFVRNVHKKAGKPYQYYKKRMVPGKRSWTMPKMGMPGMGMRPPMDFGAIMGHVAEQNKRIVGKSLKYATSHLSKGEAAKVKKKFHESFKKEWSDLMRQHSSRFQGGMMPGHMPQMEKPHGPLTSYWQKRPGKFHGKACPHGMGDMPCEKCKAKMMHGKTCPHGMSPMKCDKCAMKMKHGKECKGCDSGELCEKCKDLKAHMEKCPKCKPGKPCAMCMEMMKKKGVCDSCKAKLMGHKECPHGMSSMKCGKCKAKMAQKKECATCK